MNAPVNKAILLAKRDHEGIILDLLDDIVRAETRSKQLVDRLDSISKRSSIRVVDIDLYVWTVALIALVTFALGCGVGYLLRGLHG
jgi:hypothetical protein